MRTHVIRGTLSLSGKRINWYLFVRARPLRMVAGPFLSAQDAHDFAIFA